MPCWAEEPLGGMLTLYRWNLGYRAEAVQTLEMQLSEADFRNILASREPPEIIRESVYSGCYLASYRAANRGPASIGTPTSEIHRICWPRK